MELCSIENTEVKLLLLNKLCDCLQSEKNSSVSVCVHFCHMLLHTPPLHPNCHFNLGFPNCHTLFNITLGSMTKGEIYQGCHICCPEVTTSKKLELPSRKQKGAHRREMLDQLRALDTILAT